MQKYNLKFRLFETYSGNLYQLEELQGQFKINYYAYNWLDNNQDWTLKMEEKLSNCNTVRQFQKQVLLENQHYYLFTYIDGQTLERQITIHKGNNQMIPLEKIQFYLKQTLETLYQIHKQFILGRVFSTKNIMDCNNQILFLDFGFGPKMLQYNTDLIFPPEILQKYVDKQSYDCYYDIKIDSWLLGALLFHLVKLTPINALIVDGKFKFMQTNDLNEYWIYVKQQMESSVYIDAMTERYPKELCQFIQGLLTYRPNQRLSFQQIYQDEFIKSLNLPKYQEYLSFYQNYNSSKLNEQIKGNEASFSQIVSTKTLQKGSNDNQSKRISITPLDLDRSSQFETKSFTLPQTSSRLNEDQSINQTDNIENSFVYQIQGLSESKFYIFWQHIRMELFRQAFLEKCAEEFELELKKKKNFELENVLVYFLRKMGYLILVELQQKINQDDCPWISDKNEKQKWKEFQNERQKEILENTIKQKISELGPIQKELFSKYCQIYLTDERIDEVIRKQLKADQYNLQSSMINGNSIYKCTSKEFLKNGYRSFLELTFKFLEREKKLNKEPIIRYNTLLLKALICFLINKIFNLSHVKQTFKDLLQGRKTTHLLTPNEIYSYVCRDDELKKQDDTIHIWNIYFGQQQEQQLQQ